MLEESRSAVEQNFQAGEEVGDGRTIRHDCMDTAIA